MKNQHFFKFAFALLMCSFNFSSSIRGTNPSLLGEKTIQYKFSDISISGNNYIDATVEVASNQTDIAFGNAVIFIKYNSACLGSNIVSNGLFSVEKSSNINNNFYSVQVSDSTSNIVKISILSSFGSQTPTLLLNGTFKKLIKLKFKVTDWSQLANINFDEFSMTNQSWYFDIDRTYKPFDRVLANSPITSASVLDEPVALTYEFDSVEYSNDGTDNFVKFNVNVHASQQGTFLAFTGLYIKYGSGAFLGNAVASGNLEFTNGLLFPSPLYKTMVADNLGNRFLVNYSTPTNLGLTPVPTVPTKMFSIKLRVAGDCFYTTQFSFGEADMQGFSVYFASGPVSSIQYAPIIANDTYDQVACDDGKRPFIKQIFPLTVAAGIFDSITIIGKNFGTDKPTIGFQNVYFENSNVFNNAYPEDILFWSDTLIRCLIPSTTITGTNNVSPASTGRVKVENLAGLSVSDDVLFVKYAIKNFRDFFKKPNRISVVDFDNNGGYKWEIDNSFDSLGVTDCIKESLCYWNQQTGINWKFSDTTKNIIMPSPNGVNEIVFANTNSTTVIAYTTNEPVQCAGGYVFTENDIVIGSNHVFNLNCSDSTLSGFSFKGTILHELGHAHMLDHAKPNPLIMHPKDSKLQSIVAFDVEGGLDALDFSINHVPCYSQMITGSLCKTNHLTDKKMDDFFKVDVFPNPTSNGELHLSLNQEVNEHVEFFLQDLLGKQVDFKKSQTSSSTFTINVGEICKGVYFLTVKDGVQIKTKKIIIQ